MLPPDIEMLKTMLEGAEIEYHEIDSGNIGSTVFFDAFSVEFNAEGGLVRFVFEE
jgi:hypothetical protein